MKIILLATWPNGQTQHIYSTTSRLIATSKHNAKLNRHIIEVTGPDAKFLTECIWTKTQMSPAVPMVVDDNYDPLPLGSELGPAYGYDDKGNQVVSGLKFVKPEPIQGAEVRITNEPNQKEAIPPVEEIRQELPESRELQVVQEQPNAQEPKAAPEIPGELTVEDEEDPEDLMSLEELICKRVAEFSKLKVSTLAANLGSTEAEIRSAVKGSALLKITGAKKQAAVVAK